MFPNAHRQAHLHHFRGCVLECRSAQPCLLFYMRFPTAEVDFCNPLILSEGVHFVRSDKKRMLIDGDLCEN